MWFICVARVAQLDYQLNIQGREKYIIAMCSAAISEMIYNICRYNCFLKTPGEQIYRFSEGTGVLHNPMQICRKKRFKMEKQGSSQTRYIPALSSALSSCLCSIFAQHEMQRTLYASQTSLDVSLLKLSPLHFQPINAEISPADSQARG